jgi:hypothetical protein
MSMTRAELVALRDALEAVLSWPDSVRAEVARWLTPEAAKPNGLGNGAGQEPLKKLERLDAPRRSPTPYAGRVRRGRPPTSAKTAEQRLLVALQEGAGNLSVIELARALGSGRSAVGERLRQLARRGAIEKTPQGRWRVKTEETEARPTEAPST